MGLVAESQWVPLALVYQEISSEVVDEVNTDADKDDVVIPPHWGHYYSPCVEGDRVHTPFYPDMGDSLHHQPQLHHRPPHTDDVGQSGAEDKNGALLALGDPVDGCLEAHYHPHHHQHYSH